MDQLQEQKLGMLQARRSMWIAVGAGALLLVVGLGFGVWYLRQPSHVALPIEANRLPAKTEALERKVIRTAEERDPDIRQMRLAGFLGSTLCEPSADDPVDELLALDANLRKAAQYFQPDHQDAVRDVMLCGREMAAKLQSPYLTAITFHDDEDRKQIVLVFDLSIDRLPSTHGYIRQSFSGIDGFCYVPGKDSAGKCAEGSLAAIRDDNRWFAGSRGAIAVLARSFRAPREHMSSLIDGLQEAADEMSGLDESLIHSRPASSRPFLAQPCQWAAEQVAGSSDEFLAGCYASSGRHIEVIDSKLRAAAIEFEPNIEKAGAVRGQVVLVARDSDAAEDMQKDLHELTVDWKSHLENNEAKLIKLATHDASTSREQLWAAAITPFVRALKAMELSRSGRVVKLTFDQKLSDDEVKQIREAVPRNERRKAAVDIMTAIEKQQPLPLAALSQLIGASQAKVIDGMLAPTQAVAAAAGTPDDSTVRTTSRSGMPAAHRVMYQWLLAQNTGELNAYRALYASDFVGIKRVGSSTQRYGRSGWLADRGRMFAKPMVVTATDRTITPTEDGYVVRFTQSFSSGNFSDTGTKEIVLRDVGGELLIVREEMLNSAPNASSALASVDME